jgi:hypothetical protein
MAARKVAAFAQPSVLLLSMAARKEPILFFEQLFIFFLDTLKL